LVSARTAREPRAAARSRSGNAHRWPHRRRRAARRRHARGSRAGAGNPRAGQTKPVARWRTLTPSGGVRTGTAMTAAKKIVFQGEPGANSHLASRDAYPDYEPVPAAPFEDAFAAINAGDAELGMIPFANSIARPVTDIHHLLPDSGLHIVA